MSRSARAFAMLLGTMKKLGLLVALLLLVIGGGYVAWRYAWRVHPEPPPRGAATAAARVGERESSIRVPVAIDAGLIARVAEARVPKHLLSQSGLDAGGGVTVDLVARRTEAITVEARDGKLHLRVPVAADLTASAAGGLLGLMRRGPLRTRAAFVIRAELDLGVDAQWNLATSTQATLRWEEDPEIALGPVRVRLSALVGDRIDAQFAAAVSTVVEQLRARVPMRALLAGAWAATFRPLPIGAGGDLWLALRPTGLFLGEVAARDGHVFLDAGIRGVFRVVVGAAPPAAEPTPLPPRSPPPPGLGTALELPIAITFEAANDQLDRRVEGQVLQVPMGVGGRTVPLTIGAVEVYPSGERIAVALEFSAELPGQWLDVRGEVYLVGTPVLDAARSQLRVVDLAYDAKTDLALVDVAEWMLHGEIVRRVEGLLVFDFAERVDAYRDRVNAEIADYAVSPTIRLRGAVHEAKVAALTITDPAVVALAQLRGEARLEVAPAANAPGGAPADAPGGAPTNAPSGAPSGPPTNAPSGAPTNEPGGAPTNAPSGAPTNAPGDAPTNAPSGEQMNTPRGERMNAPSDTSTSAPGDAPPSAPPGAPADASQGAPPPAP